ncbi:MAG TPA: 30S ribosome-binding factor RbfA [Candidatus Saccharimonadales bacterium]|nr:30S ribosome-binding factor RbfA [Candidatus Saccharimonadales bacterium]
MTLRSGARSPRRERVGEQLREELSAMILTEMKDPRVRLASISRVRCSPDLREAWLSVSALGDDAERENVVETLTRAEGFLRGQLGRRLENLRSIPRLHFELDESIAYGVRVSTLLRDLEAERPAEAPVEVPE